MPSDAEWEKVARGTDGRIYPWGNDMPTKERCNFNRNVGDTTPLGNYSSGKSFYGLLDMAGNVCEWTRTLSTQGSSIVGYRYPYIPTDGRESQDAPSFSGRVLHGGSFISNQKYLRCADRSWSFATHLDHNVGFRVVRHETMG